ncbi:MAG TPA: hypothetical protein VNQ79_20270 [Blastocatellia bacterium]|nr:hypothetical protein [Blastocatellia bacterium]
MPVFYAGVSQVITMTMPVSENVTQLLLPPSNADGALSAPGGDQK